MYIYARSGPGLWVREGGTWTPRAQRMVNRAKRKESRLWGNLSNAWAIAFVLWMPFAALLYGSMLFSSATDTFVRENAFWVLAATPATGFLLLLARPAMLRYSQSSLRRLAKALPPGVAVSQLDPRLQAKSISTYIHWADGNIGSYIDLYLYKTAPLIPLMEATGSQEQYNHLNDVVNVCAGFTGDAIFDYRRTDEVQLGNLRTGLGDIVRKTLRNPWPRSKANTPTL